MTDPIVRGIVDKLYGDDAARQPCTWTQTDPSWDDCNTWETTCGEAYIFIDGGPAENRAKFCCYCGAPIMAKPYVYEDEDAEPEAPEVR